MHKRFDLWNGKGIEPREGAPPVRYFLPGQIILQVRHPADFDVKKIASEINEYLSYSPQELQKDDGIKAESEMGEQNWRSQIRPIKPESILLFPAREGESTTVSIVPARLRTEEMGEKELFDLTIGINKQLRGGNVKTLGGLVFEAASPNWLVGGSPGQSGTGGPGSWPTPEKGPVGESWRFNVQNQHGAIDPSLLKGDGNDIHVAILDTMPTRHAMKVAYQDWRWSHPLVESLLKEGGPLQTYPATYEELYQVEGYDLRGHRYLMRDHGLFIAGIVHSLAPKATIHLYEVLNPYGVGSIETIARGILKILTNDRIPKDCPLIINCSFMLGLPSEGIFDPDYHFEVNDPSDHEELSFTTRRIFTYLAQRRNTILVAAAGNDGFEDKSNNSKRVRPTARYPAAFSNVVGVGALSKQDHRTIGNYIPAVYSNLSDQPPHSTQPPIISYITLGGEPGPQEGVLGVYIGEFPDLGVSLGCLGRLLQMLGLIKKSTDVYTVKGYSPGDRFIDADAIKYLPNRTGWGRWSGTSFATPIISGILAAQHSQPGMGGREIDSEAERHLSSFLQINRTKEEERVILLSQGLP